MIIDSVEPPSTPAAEWRIIGRIGEVLSLPSATSGPFRVGLLGTRNALKSKKTDAMAGLLAGVGGPIVVIDTRRTGAGGSGSWGPLEFATLIPKGMADRDRRHVYAYHHFPDLAPSPELLRLSRAAVGDEQLELGAIGAVATRVASGSPAEVPACAWRHWQVFRAAYLAALAPHAVLAARAFVEAVTKAGGLAVFLCAEAHMSDFDSAPQAVQDRAYCHRFTLASAVARSLRAAFPGEIIRRVSLSLDQGEIPHEWRGSGWYATP